MQDLDLSENQITTIPADIGTLENLKHLDLSLNQIRSVNPVIFITLKKLTGLNLLNNKLTQENKTALQNKWKEWNKSEKGLSL